MSYPKDLDEYTDKQILNELNRRLFRAYLGRCSYCDTLLDESKICKCKMGDNGDMFTKSDNGIVYPHVEYRQKAISE